MRSRWRRKVRHLLNRCCLRFGAWKVEVVGVEVTWKTVVDFCFYRICWEKGAQQTSLNDHRRGNGSQSRFVWDAQPSHDHMVWNPLYFKGFTLTTCAGRPAPSRWPRRTWVPSERCWGLKMDLHKAGILRMTIWTLKMNEKQWIENWMIFLNSDRHFYFERLALRLDPWPSQHFRCPGTSVSLQLHVSRWKESCKYIDRENARGNKKRSFGCLALRTSRMLNDVFIYWGMYWCIGCIGCQDQCMPPDS